MIDDTNTPQTDENLFALKDYEENYFKDNHSERYAIRQCGENCEIMEEVDTSMIDAQYGRFRKLTPRECLRLMGFDDTFKIVCSDTETYKQAGNSIIVDVLMALMKQIDITKYGYNG